MSAQLEDKSNPVSPRVSEIWSFYGISIDIGEINAKKLKICPIWAFCSLRRGVAKVYFVLPIEIGKTKNKTKKKQNILYI